jgi:lipopolysaccharide transport system permease protein
VNNVAPASIKRTLVIQAESQVRLNLRELWPYRDLIFFLAWRDVSVRYKQTVLGVLWAVIQPFAAMVIFSVFFGELLGVESGNIPYPLFTYAALLPWQYFSSALGEIALSLVNNQTLVTKVYFPRLIIPIASALPPLVDVAIAGLIYLLLMLLYGVNFTWGLLLLPFFLALAILTALAFGVWLASLTVVYRDFRYIIQFMLQLWLFASPVMYASSIVPTTWRPLYSLNPMVSVIDGFRWALLGAESPALIPLAVSVAVVLSMLAGGLYFFRRIEGSFADVI